jgi:hypothetical protein
MVGLVHGRSAAVSILTLLVLSSYIAAQEPVQSGQGNPASDNAEARRAANEQVAKLIAER